MISNILLLVEQKVSYISTYCASPSRQGCLTGDYSIERIIQEVKYTG